MKRLSHLLPCGPLSLGLFCLGAALVALAGWQGTFSRHDSAAQGIDARNVSFDSSEAALGEFPTRSIEDLRPGDQVLALEPETGEYAWKTVEHSLRRETNHLRILTVESSRDGSTQTIRTTDEHPFWVPDSGWTEAGDLEPNDALLLAGGDVARLIDTRREEHPERVAVYNLTVEGYHTYFVSQNASRAPVLVHNANRCAEVAQTTARLIARNADEAAAAARGSKTVGVVVDGHLTPMSGIGRRGGESAAAAKGRAEHLAKDYGPGFQKEVTLPSGKRVDAVNFDTGEVVELKPNNPRAVKRGEKQVEGYRQELEELYKKPFTGRVETYN